MTDDGFDHPALLYRGAAGFLAGTLPFLRDGLDGAAAVAVALPGDHLALIRDALGERADEVTLFDLTVAGRNPGRILPTVLLAFADAHRDRPVRIIGEPIWPGRPASEYSACVQHEALINLAFAGRSVAILCPYDRDRLDPEVLADAERTHPVLIDDAGRRGSDHFGPRAVLAACNLPLPVPAELRVSRLLFNGRNLDDVRDYVVAQALRLGLSRSRADDVQAAVVELATNSIQHGGGRGTVEIWAADGEVIGQVTDGGTVTDPLAGRRPARPDEPAGRGLVRVHQLADLVGTHAVAGQTITRVHFRLTGHPLTFAG